MKSTTKTVTKTITSRSGATSGLASGNRTVTTKRTVVDLDNGVPQTGLRRSSRGSRVWKKTVLGEKFEFAEKLKEKKNYILYVSGIGHKKKLIEELEEAPKPEPPKEKVVEVKQIIDNYGYHETKNVKKKDPKRLSITHHERLSTPFERTTLKKFSSYTTDPNAKRYTSTSVQKTRYDTEPVIKKTTQINQYNRSNQYNQYNSMTSKQERNKTIVPPKLYETYKPAKTQITKTTRTIVKENKAPNTISQTRNKINTQITKTKTEITKYGDRRSNNQNINQNIIQKTQKKIKENKYKRPSPADLGINQTKTETHQDGEYIVKVTTTRTQIGKYGKPEEKPRGGSVPRFMGPHGPHGPMPRMPGFERPRFETRERIEQREERIERIEREEKRGRSFERPHGFMGPHGPMPHGPHGFMGPMPHGPHGPMPHGPHGFMGPHGPMPHGPHGFMPPREVENPKREKMLTEGNVKEEGKDNNITGMSQYRFQQTTSSSDNGHNFEYFESKNVVKKGNQPITIHRYRGDIGGYEDSGKKQDNRSSSYNKKITTTTTQTITRNNNVMPKIETKTYQNIRKEEGKSGAGMISTKYTQKTTTIKNVQNVKKEEKKGTEKLNEFKKYSQKEKTDASASSASKYGMKQTVTETKIQENEALYQAFASGEFEYIICPVHGKQLVRKKKFKKIQ